MMRSPTLPPPSRRILAVSLADIGDLIQTTPALRLLRQTYPAARIDVLTTRHAAPILSHTDLADRVITFDKFAFDRPASLLNPRRWPDLATLILRLRRGRYDTILIFHQLTTRFGALKYAALAYASAAHIRAGLDNGRGGFLTHRVPDLGFGIKHQAEYWLSVVGAIPLPSLPGEGVGGRVDSPRRTEVGISDADRAFAAAHSPPDALILHPGSGGFSTARRWEAEKFARLADRIHAEDPAHPAIVIVGGKNDGADAVIAHLQSPCTDLTGQTTLNQLAAVIARGSRYIGADSGVMHIAASTGVKVDALFGPSNPGAWRPYSENAVVHRSGSLCSPCSYVGHTVGLRHGCTARTCMKMLQPDDLVSAKVPDPGYPERWRDPALYLLGVPVDALTFDEQIAQIGTWITAFRSDRAAWLPRQICSVNPEYIITAQRDLLLYLILNRCSMTAPDGVGVLWAARQRGFTLPERVTGSDGLPKIADAAARHGWKLFLLGARDGIAVLAANKLRAEHPNLQIVGTYAGSPSADEEDQIAAMVAQSGADILFVAYGGREQEHWIARNLPRLNVAACLGVGGAFDFVAGATERAPVWMRRAGIEWVHRLLRQPWRWRRMLRLPLFVLLILTRGDRPPRAFGWLNRH